MRESEWPSTAEEWCEWFRMLDKRFDTDKDSPLHHDNRCPIHTAWRRN